jgi:ABC-type branched-subunit amino acid transport system substrate-binding protein
MIKNIIIVILSLFLAFFIYLKMDNSSSFNYIDRDFQKENAEDRSKAVESASNVEIVVVIGNDNYTAKESLQGIKTAVDLINAGNGVKGKKINLLVKYTDGTKPKYLEAVQEFCTPKKVAACIGPYISAFTPSTRAITQFESVPLVSPMTIYSEKLPPLNPDNFVSYFPQLDIWIKALMDNMSQHSYKNLLIISPKNNSYGDIFSTALQSYNNQQKIFDAIYRVNFQPPMNRQAIQNSLVGHEAIGTIDAIFFAGDYDDYLRLKVALKNMKMIVPVYTTEDLNVDDIDKDDYPGELVVPILRVTKLFNQDFAKEYKKQYGAEPNFNIILSGMVIYDISEQIAKNGYEPIDLSKKLRKKAELFYEDKDAYFIDFIRNKK